MMDLINLDTKIDRNLATKEIFMSKKNGQSCKVCLLTKYLTFLSLISLVSCASVPSVEVRQQVEVMTASADGAAIHGAICDLKNNKGAWSVITPNKVDVIQSDVSLQVTCNKAGYRSATVSISKQTEGRVLGDIGGFGKLVIGGSSSARPAFMGNGDEMPKYQYPSKLNVTLSALPFEDAPARTVQHGGLVNNKTPNEFEDAKKKCEEIGFRKGTENFGLCVMKLIN